MRILKKLLISNTYKIICTWFVIQVYLFYSNYDRVLHRPEIESNNIVDQQWKETIEIQPIDQQTLKPVAVHVLRLSGLGSQLLNMLSHKLFYKDIGRKFIVDESIYRYKRNEQNGVLSGFFTPGFPVVSCTEHYPKLMHTYNLTFDNDTNHFHPSTSTAIMNPNKYPTIISPLTEFTRGQIFQTYDVQSPYFYNRMANEVCQHLKFNKETQKNLDEYKAYIQIPDLTQSHSVAFHIRRGDKVIQSKSHEASEYVHKLYQSISHMETSKIIQDCFVATDDYKNVIPEIAKALRKHGMNCTIHVAVNLSSTREPNEMIVKEDDVDVELKKTIHLLTEISLMMDATYFVGAFESNVVALVSLMRTCGRNDISNYANTFGVGGGIWKLP